MIDFEKFADKVVEEVQRHHPEITESFIRDEVDKLTIEGKIDAWDLARKYSHLCPQCGWCCEDMGCEHLRGKLCSIQFDKPKFCIIYPCWELKDEEGLYPDPYCGLAVKIAKYEVIKKAG
jgi:hypothetical protein